MKQLLILMSLLLPLILHAQKELKRIQLLLPNQNSFRSAGFLAAKEQGFYRDAGFDLTIVVEENPSKLTQEVLKKKNSYGVGSFGLMNEILKKHNVVLIGSVLQQTPQVLIAEGKAQSAPQILNALRGKTVMLARDEDRVFLDILLRKAHLCAKDVKILYGKSLFESLLAHSADAIVASKAQMMTGLKKSSENYQIVEPSELGLHLYDDIIFTSSNQLNSQPRDVEAFYKATIEGWKYAFAHMYKSSAEIVRWRGDSAIDPLSLVVEADALKLFAFRPDSYLGQIDFAKVQKMMGLFQSEGAPSVEISQLLYNKGHLKSEEIFSKEEHQQLAGHKEIRICVDINNLPLEGIGEKGEFIGIIADMCHVLETQTGVLFKPIPVASPQEKKKAFDAGSCDLYATHSTDSYEGNYVKTGAILTVPVAYITQTQERFHTDISQIIQGKIAVTKGDPIITELKKLYPSINIIEVESAAEGLKGVSNSEYKAFAGLLPVCSYYINRQGLSNLKAAGHIDIEMPIRFLLPLRWSELLTPLNKAINTIDETRRNKITQSWVDIDYKGGVDYTIFVLILLVASVMIALISYFNYKLRARVEIEMGKRRVQEQMLIQQSKLAGIGEMIGNIAHQWRQPLMGLSALMMEIEAKIQTQGGVSNDELHSIVERSNKTMRFMSTTINDFWSFFAKDKEAVAFRPGEVIETTLTIINASLKKSGLKVDLHSCQECELYGFKNEFAQAIINLISNAKDIMEERNIIDPKLEIKIEKDQYSCFITFEDNGGGIKIEPVERIFEPFISERVFPSSGIGLCMTKNIITGNMRGEISAENSTKGAKFTIVMPLA